MKSLGKRFFFRNKLNSVYSSLIFQFFRSTILVKKSLGIRSDQIKNRNDILFIVNEVNKGWILDKICKIVSQNSSIKHKIHYTEDCNNLPVSSIYFFSHYLLFLKSIRQTPRILYSKSIVFYTHTNEYSEIKKVARSLNDASKIICMCSQVKEQLSKNGTQHHKLKFVLGGGADPKRFTYHERGSGCIGLCSAFYPRKNPDAIFALVEQMNHHDFLLLGQGWEKYDNFQSLIQLPNFKYIEADYQDYPQYYAMMDIFISLSTLEGGPIPLLEAMMSNIFPVVSATGFAPDLITHGHNGLLFEVGAPLEQIKKLIEQGLSSRVNIRETVKHLTWIRFAREINAFIDLI